MGNKIAMMGFGNVTLFPVIKNDSSGYKTGEGFKLPWVQEMTKDTDTSEVKIYADDTIYLTAKSWNGIKATLTAAEMPLDTFARLGFGELSADKKTLKWNPQGMNKQFAMSFRCLRADGSYRMMKLFSFTINEVKESNLKTKGGGTEISTYQIIGTFTQRVTDGIPGEIHDGSDLDWLETIENSLAGDNE